MTSRHTVITTGLRGPFQINSNYIESKALKGQTTFAPSRASILNSTDKKTIQHDRKPNPQNKPAPNQTRLTEVKLIHGGAIKNHAKSSRIFNLQNSNRR